MRENGVPRHKRWLTLFVLLLASSCAKQDLGGPPPSPESIPALQLAVLTAVGGRLTYCDPDQYPIAHGRPIDNARERLPIIQADAPAYDAILAKEGLTAGQEFTDDELLAINEDYKQLQAIRLQAYGDLYSFSVLVPKSGAPSGNETVSGTVSTSGSVKVTTRGPGQRLNCPICLAAGDRIATPFVRFQRDRMRHSPIVALVLAGTVAAAGGPATVLPKPRFNAPAREPAPGRVTFQILSSSSLDPGRLTPDDDPAKNKPGSVGQLLPNTEARVVDVESGQDVGPNEDGEIWIRGPQVMRGYLNNPEATAATIDPEGWLHSGDIGHADEDGYFTIVDRLKELIKYKGYQVPPAELEAVLVGHPAIADAAVIPRRDEESGEVPVAFVVMREQVTPDEIMAYVAERVASHMKIRAVEVVDEIPKSASGKILRRVLVQRERERQDQG